MNIAQTDKKSYHIPIMFNEVMDGLKLFDGGIWLDATMGGGGHTLGLLERTAPLGRVIAIDRDIEAIRHNEALKQRFQDRLTILHQNHDDFKDILSSLNIEKIDGALFDLGLSSHQIDTQERGFSYIADAPLDMRMDTSKSLTAEDVINNYTEKELSDIFYLYGEEEFSRRIATAIVLTREKQRITSTKQLNDIISACVPKAVSIKRGHASKKVFQSIRIEVNGELKLLDKTIRESVSALNSGGRIAIISFHSLEDRIVKQVFKELSAECICPKSLPVCVCGHKATLKVVTKKPLTATERELIRNPRAFSAKLRIAEKLY